MPSDHVSRARSFNKVSYFFASKCRWKLSVLIGFREVQISSSSSYDKKNLQSNLSHATTRNVQCLVLPASSYITFNDKRARIVIHQSLTTMVVQVVVLSESTLGSFSNDDGNGNGNENVKKTIGLLSKTRNLHVHHAFFVLFSAASARQATWKCLLSRFIEDVNKRQRIFLSLSKL